MNKRQLIQIAKVGFPEIVHEQINLENAEMHVLNNVYRLHAPNVMVSEMFGIPTSVYMSIHIEEDFVQIRAGHMMFNHYAAIKEMEKMGLI